VNDKEAFKKWWEGFVKKDLGLNVKAIADCKVEKAWKSACEYKQKEIDELKNQDRIISKEIKTYMTIAENLRTVVKINQDENMKLREVIEFYANETSWDDIGGDCLNNEISGSDLEHIIGDTVIGGKRARQVLKELEDK
jgi:CRISPR/Cas system CSM-associated protein Csm4 (group 5 of RAMP superfamily)